VLIITAEPAQAQDVGTEVGYYLATPFEIDQLEAVVRRSEATRRHVMYQWEYLVAIAEAISQAQARVRWINAQELQNWQQGPPLAEFLNQQGAQGWELVSAQLASPGAQFIFKRPKP
jgi:hypothetical protein